MLRSESYTATSVMVRRLVENFCRQQGGGDRAPLASMLRTLHANEVLDKHLFDWANMLRTLGNEGAHSLDDVDQQAARDALHFSEAVLDYTYVLAARFEDFQNRRSKTGGKPVTG